MHNYPTHVHGFVENANHLFLENADEFHHSYQIKCSNCKCRLFHLFTSNKQSCKAQCHNCHAIAIIYDLSYYPCAPKIQGKEVFIEIEQTKEFPRKCFVAYEYGQLDEDQQFDQNDITWCKIFIEAEGKMLIIFDHETA